MKWNKATRLGLYAALEMARAQGQLVTAASVAARYGISPHHLAKVFQQLTRAGLAQAVLGVGGGYRLARSPKEITLLQVVQVFERLLPPERCALADAHEACGLSAACRLKSVFDEIEQQAVATLGSIRLSTLVSLPTEEVRVVTEPAPRAPAPRPRRRAGPPR